MFPSDNIEYIPNGYWKCTGCGVLVSYTETHMCEVKDSYLYSYQYSANRDCLLQIIKLLEEIKTLLEK